MALCKGTILRPHCIAPVYHDGMLCNVCYISIETRNVAIEKLTDYQREVLRTLDEGTSYTQHGDGPWERSFVSPGSPARARAMRNLALVGLIDYQRGYRSDQWRSRLPIPPAKLAELD